MKISIITVAFNSEKTIEETMISVLKQTYRPLQYIIIDGQSVDGTLDLIKKYEDRFKNKGIEFEYISEKDYGISNAFNKGISLVSGEIIGIINSDDKLCDDSLKILSNEYKREIDIYYGQCVIFNDDSAREYIATPNASRNLNLLDKGMALFHPSTFITKRVYEKYGGYDEKLKYCMDRELLLKLKKMGCNFKYIDHPLAYYREGGTNQVNYKKCSRENMEISIRYNTPYYVAWLNKQYYVIHDYLWKVIKTLGLERLFHKEINDKRLSNGKNEYR